VANGPALSIELVIENMAVMARQPAMGTRIGPRLAPDAAGLRGQGMGLPGGNTPSARC
jgi:hypothetical protein